MIDFAQVKRFVLPEGAVQTMMDERGNVLWRAPQPEVYPINYVSLGDSIAAGHAINDEWAKRYGTGSQYGSNGNKQTAIVPGCYTDLIRGDLVSVYGADNVNAVSFAKSGERVKDLIPKLDHAEVRAAIADAHIVTLCIGANDVLEPALSNLAEYINTGDLSPIMANVESNLAVLADDGNAMSFKALFDKLISINPHAKYIFTTIYNPYKFLWLDEGKYGFFEPVLSTIPNMDIDVDKVIEDRFLGGKDLAYYDFTQWKWVSIELEIDVDSLIKEGLLATPIVRQLYDRVNGLGDYSENFVVRLNAVLRDAVARYQATSENISLVDTKAVFDLFPDRQNSGSVVEYNELVNVEFTRGYDTMQMDWGALWRDQYGNDPASYWWGLAWKHLHFQASSPYVNFDLGGLAADVIAHTIERVIVPNVDPHPEDQGQAVMRAVFANGIGLVRYNTPKSWCAAGAVANAGGALDAATPHKWGYTFDGWFADADCTTPHDGTRRDYANNKTFALTELDGGGYVRAIPPKTTDLYAKWTEMEV